MDFLILYCQILTTKIVIKFGTQTKIPENLRFLATFNS